MMYTDDHKPMELNEDIGYGNNAQKHTQGTYTVDDYRALPEDQRVELIDGYFIVMEAPNVIHQKIAAEVHEQIADFIRKKKGDCIVLESPLDVQLDCDEHTMVQPDVVILCDDDKIKLFGIYGAPDFVLEVVSPTTRKMDSTKKLAKYENAGVREYWILDPYTRRLLVYFFEDSTKCPSIYGFGEPVPVNIYDGELKIDLSGITKWVQRFEV